MKKIEREELVTRLDRGDRLVLLEALPEKSYAAGHLPGARLFPHDQAESLARVAIGDKDAEVIVYEVIVYCASETCANSALAAETLGRLGYSRVSVYEGGKVDWEAAGLPLVRG